MSMRRVRYSLFLASTALAGPALAQEPNVHLNELTVETVRPTAPLSANVSGGDGNSAVMSGGGGGPSGVTGYTARVSPAATKTNTPLIETPQSVSVVTREQLNDRNVQSVNEALAYTPGLSTNVFGFDPRNDAFYIRGFSETYDGVFRDGLRQSAVGLTVPRIEPYGTEALTILRGPASSLYGLGSPGGIVDVTSKRPVFAPFGEVWFQGGNFDRYQGNFDIGAPVAGSDGTMAYRLTGVVRQSDTFLPGATDDRVTVAPAFTWKPAADTTLTILTEYQQTRLPGTAAFYNAPGFVVTRLYQGDAGFNTFKQEQYRIGYAFEHRFTPDLTFRQNFRYQGVGGDFPYTEITGITGLSAQRVAGFFRETLQSVALDNQLEGRFRTGPITHTLIGGLDYLHYDWTRRYGFDFNVPDLDLAGVTNFSRFGYRTFIPRPVLNSGSTQGQDQVGLYLQEQAKWDRLVLTLTGRHDWVNQATSSDSAFVPGAPQHQTDAAFTYRLGLNYLLSPAFVPYASYATTFSPQLGADARGRTFRPATGDQIEAGVKVAIPDTNITGSFAGFDIVQSSILRQDPTSLANAVATGAVESKGFEAELTANFAPGTNLTVAITQLNFRYLRQTSLLTGAPIDGNTLSGIPGTTVSAFGTYQFPLGSPLRGVQIGGGIRYNGTSFADDENTARNPTVTLFDALVAYDFAALDPKYTGFRAQINAYNIFDRTYTTCQAGYCYRGAPATVIGSLIYRW
ncbi:MULTISPECIES: TonB-dependent siderophore receptor [unclassified Methylobacterium]|jgi:iron complex outermembrane receptor protein|uniref:TonB-dependent siderophore receptor n=1 Tax=unclassified Methylobacterium TaxID=2615210 RepID=UPI0013525AE8|nr:TonB-dependent siderophore receptor [Methylobacterium sp. 2A]MWV23324.1 TonB-dependent siderophore receptor [Methylobacterium sp. 2A]